MNSFINFFFILFLIFIYYLIKNRRNLYSQDIYSQDIQENFYSNSNPLNINFIENEAPFKKKNLYSLNIKIDDNIPKIITNFKYSLEYKLGYEISKNFRIKYEDSLGLNNNLNNIISNQSKNINNLYLCSEIDFINSRNNNYNFVCSFYYQYFFIFSRIEHNIFNWMDIKNYYLKIKALKETTNTNLPVKLRVGIPNQDNNSYNDAKKLFNFIGINMNIENEGLEFIFDNEKNLFNKLKLQITKPNAIDLIYLTTSHKNPYLEEYMKFNNINLIGCQGIKKSIIEASYKNNYIFRKKIDNRKYTDVIKKKNIYSTTVGDNIDDSVFNSTNNIKLFRNDKEEKVIGSRFTETYASRIILVAHKNMDKEYIKLLLRNIYGSIDSIRNNLNKYLLYRNNIMEDCMEPYEMAYCPQPLKYHKGAKDFYKEVQFITDEENLKDNIFYKQNNENLFSKLI